MLHKSQKEDGLTIVEMLVVMLILSVLAGAGVLGVEKYRWHATNSSAQSDIRNSSTFMKEDYQRLSGFPEEIPDSFTNWSGNNELALTKQGSCVEATNPRYDDIFWRYSLVDNKIAQTPCPDPESTSNSPIPPIDDGNEEEEDPENPDPSDPNAPPAAPEPDYPIPATVSVDPILFTGSQVHGTNDLTLFGANGDLLVEGDFACNSQVLVEGSLVVTGNASFTNDCTVHGDVWIGGNVQITSTPRFYGTFQVKGNMSFQSTAYVEEGIWVRGSFDAIDGRTKEQLINGGSSPGGIWTSVEHISQFDGPNFPAYTAQTEDSIEWKDFLIEQAQRHNAPDWSDVTTGETCEVSTNQDWSLPGALIIDQDTIVDARNCDTISIGAGGGGEIELYGDLTLYVDSFTTPNGISVSSGDGQPHNFNLISPSGSVPERECTSTGNINLGNNSTFDPLVTATFYSESKVNLSGGTEFTGGVYAGCTQHWGEVLIHSD